MADANSLNIFILQGIVGRVPELIKAKKTSTTFAVLSLATHSIWISNKGKPVKTTDWHRITVWGDKLSKFTAAKVKPRMMVCCRGEIHNRKWIDGDGKERITIDFKANSLTIMRQAKVLEEEPAQEEQKPKEQKDPY